MKSFVHGFQRLPSEQDLDVHRVNQPSASYLGSPGTSYQAHLTPPPSTSQFQYDPIYNSQSESPPTWTTSPTVKILGFLSHLILTLLPIAFIVLAFLALSVDGDPLSQRGNNVYQAAKLGPSIFPILFAAVVGRLMKTFALWRAERGSTIGLLEQLNGSQNLLAAVERSFLLSGLWGWGIAIIVLWALSPLGGQSSLRVLELTQTGNTFDQELFYSNVDNYNNSIFQGASAIAFGRPAVQAIYQACLLAPAAITTSSSDIWGNVKIPLMEAQKGYTGSPKQDWIDVEHNNSTLYSSLTGVVVSGLRSDTTSTFNMESSYINLTCPTPTVFGNGGSNSNSTNIINSFRQWMGNVLVHRNASRDPFDYGFGTMSDWNSFTVDSNYNFTTAAAAKNQTPVNVIFAAKNTDVFQITAYNCTVGTSRVESSISCNGTTCRVDRMRPSRQFTQYPISTPWNQEDSYVLFVNFLNLFPWLSGTVHPGEITPADLYISGDNTPFQHPNIRGINYFNISTSLIAQRLGTLFNTVWQSSIAQSAIASPPPLPSVFQTGNSSSMPFIARSSVSTMRTSQTVYHANKLWVGCTAAISLILLVCGIAGMAFRYLTTAPDILGYVSTMTRDNPFFNDSRVSGADNLDGLERARLLRDAVVQISDVRPWNGRGHIALKSVADGNRKSSRLKRKASDHPPLTAPR